MKHTFRAAPFDRALAGRAPRSPRAVGQRAHRTESRAVTRHFATNPRVIPRRRSLTYERQRLIQLTVTTSILSTPENAEVARTAELLGLVLRPSTGFPNRVVNAGERAASSCVSRGARHLGAEVTSSR